MEPINFDNLNYEPPKKKVSKVNLIITIVSLIAIAVSLFVIKDFQTISKSEFNQIEKGMSYSEVVNIIGCDGELSSSGFNTEIYTWDGRGSIGANALITFQKGKVVSKAQSGLR